MSRIVWITALSAAAALAAVRFVPAQPAQQAKEPAAKARSETAARQRVTASEAERESVTPAGERSADEEAIHSNIEAFVDAYNQGDATAIAALFTPEGHIITEEGESVEGREAIEQGFSDLFAETPETQIEVIVDSLRFLGGDLAIELGSTVDVPAPGETPEYGRYTVLHVKRDGKWMMAAARDTEGDPPTHHERLLPLEWLTGEWIDDDGSTVVHTSCRWSDDGNFLLQDIRVQVAGRDEMQVTQRIGWDPLMTRIRSWAFDTDGGFSEGVWARAGDSWIIKSTGVGADGTPGSATSAIVPAGNDGYVWRVHDRIIGEDVQPSLEVKVVRKPPVPETASRN